jgi:ice-binding like protein
MDGMDMNKTRALSAVVGIAVLIAIGAMGSPSANAAHLPTVGLGTADGFAVLAGSGITNTGTTTINGDVGSFPTTTQTGFSSVVLTGTNHGGDAVTQGAKTDLTTAYNDAAGRTPVTTVPTELGGTTLTHGVYSSAAGTFGLTGALTLDAQGDASAVFIFQMASTLTTATASSVVLIGGAQSCNVFWQVGSSATLGGSTAFRGNILALTSITLVTSATVDGRVLARNGAVTLDTNTITRSTCAVAATPAPATPAPATATPAAPTATPAAPTATPVGSVPSASPVTSLPSTSTADLTIPFVLVVVLLAGVGVFLLRSPIQRY